MRSTGKGQTRRRVGRPPAGARAGEKVKDYPQLSVRLPGEIKSLLQAASLAAGRPQWRLLSEAIEQYVQGRPEAEQRLIAGLTARRSRSARRSRR